MYAKVLNRSVGRYPYGYQELRADNPFTAFNAGSLEADFEGTEDWVAGYRLVTVTEAQEPDYDHRTQSAALAADPVLAGDQWTVPWVISAKSDAEVAAYDAAAAEDVRASRNRRLASCDWTQLADAPVDKAAWAAYRQALRDVPDQPGFPLNVTWPSEPA